MFVCTSTPSNDINVVLLSICRSGHDPLNVWRIRLQGKGFIQYIYQILVNIDSLRLDMTNCCIHIQESQLFEAITNGLNPDPYISMTLEDKESGLIIDSAVSSVKVSCLMSRICFPDLSIPMKEDLHY